MAPRRDAPLDLRLVAPAIALWCAVLAGLHTNATYNVLLGALVVVGAACGLAGWAGGRRQLFLPARSAGGLRHLFAPAGSAGGRRQGFVPARSAGGRRQLFAPAGWAAVVLAAALGAAIGFAAAAAQVARRDAVPVAALSRAGLLEVRASTVEDPRQVRGSGGPGGYAVAARLDAVRQVGGAATPGVPPGARLLVLAADPGWSRLLPGQRFTAVGRLQRPRGGDLTAAVLRPRGGPWLVGAAPWYQRAAGRLRAGLQGACAALPDDPGGLLPGLAVGDTSRLTPEVGAAFRTAGMTHLVAVSGSNVALVLAAVLLVARWCRAPRWLVGAGGVAALAGFVVLVRPSASVLRAAAMGALGIVALVSGRPRAAVPALAATVMVLLVADAGLAADRGFGLSVCATGGLLLLAPGWRDRLARRRVPRPVAEALAVASAAQVACAPLVAAIAGGVSLVAVPANLVAAPAVAPATMVGVCAAVLAPFASVPAGWAAWLGGWPARWLVLVARTAAGVPLAVPWPAGARGAALLAALLVGTAGVLRVPALRRIAAVLVLAGLAGAAPVRLFASGWPPDGSRFVACDVGQGDALVVPVAAASAVVVDAGPEPDSVDGCLRALGVRHVPLLIVTHLHADHAGGLAGVLRGRSVTRLLAPVHQEPVSGMRLLRGIADRSGIPVHTAVVGTGFRFGAVWLRVLGPSGVLRGTRSDPNNNSTVLRVDTGGVRLLLLGDAEREQQAALWLGTDPAALAADVVKIGHHGSAYQDYRLLDAARPVVALVSVGAGNRYGQPHPDLLTRVRQRGVQVYRTDHSGSLAVAVRASGRWGIVPARGRPP